MDEKKMVRNLVELYLRTGCDREGDLKLIRVQDHKTTYVEPNGDGGRSIYMDEYSVDGKNYWVGYSSRTQTVYISQAA